MRSKTGGGNRLKYRKHIAKVKSDVVVDEDINS